MFIIFLHFYKAFGFYKVICQGSSGLHLSLICPISRPVLIFGHMVAIETSTRIIHSSSLSPPVLRRACALHSERLRVLVLVIFPTRIPQISAFYAMASFTSQSTTWTVNLNQSELTRREISDQSWDRKADLWECGWGSTRWCITWLLVCVVVD